MRLLGNIIWIICWGLVLALSWVILGLAFMVTIVGIPLGVQCFKIAALSLSPFGKEIEYSSLGFWGIIGNIVWVVFVGIWVCIGNLIAGLIFCLTIIGIPFGLQCFKLAKLSLFPFGARIYEI